MYSLLGLSAFIPIIHSILLHGWKVQNQRMSVTYFLGLALLNFSGAVTYASRIPERWYPRRFDIYGASHQIMHLLVILGALSHTTGLVRAFDYWHSRRAGGVVVC
ncbi:MAG: adiponectin receptor 1 [Lasallia pustulata]|uniref:Adiponectin receptor 1 n=1 Tax=Lasallia pustulata TaxID=136370 RepID=A0A5M8PT49_9LECA|nr:MAG: adiponectin receptor 1 [Lasallia pustulata]